MPSITNCIKTRERIPRFAALHSPSWRILLLIQVNPGLVGSLYDTMVWGNIAFGAAMMRARHFKTTLNSSG